MSLEEFNFPYTNSDLTQEVNRIPNTFGLLNALDIAPIETLGSRFVRIDYRNGSLVVLAAEARGAPGQVTSDDDEGGIILEIPHFPHLETVNVDDVDNLVQVVNGKMELRSLDKELAKRLLTIRKMHAITLEYIRLGMLKGLIKDGKGKTLYDLFSVFGITKKTISMELSNEDTNVMDKCEEIGDHIRTNLMGETTSGVEQICSSSLFNALISHPNVEKFWVQAQNSALHTELQRQYAGGNWGRVFDFGNIIWREYKGGLPVNNNGAITTAANVTANYGHAYPAGTMDMIKTFEAPAYHMDTVNQEPEPDTIQISIEELKHGKGFEMLSQTNRVPICKQPECLVEVQKG